MPVLGIHEGSSKEPGGMFSLLYSVVVKNLNKSLSTAEARKNIIDSVCGATQDMNTIKIRRNRSGFKVLINNKPLAEKISRSFKVSD